jgi:muramoyltetrapeptide carboxypeptidase
MKGYIGPLRGFTEWKALRSGRAEGQFVGGNLYVLLSLMGTPYEPKWENKILFWEETGENIESIDNFLWRLRLAKVFKKIEGMIVGKISDLESIEDEGKNGHSSKTHPPLNP